MAVAMSYRVRGMNRPFLTLRRVSARKTSAGWRISGDVARREPLPWEVASFKATRVPHVVLLTPPGVDVAPLRSGLARAYREIRRDLPERDLPRSVLVIGARDAAQAERLTGRIAHGVVALANVSVKFGPAPALAVERVLAQRMLVIDSRWSALPESERHSTLVHEMTHTALDPDTSGRTPPWLAEGVAMYVSGDDRAAEARLRAAGAAASLKLRRLCRPNSIFRLDGKAQGAAYAASSGAAEAIVARNGTRGLFEALRRLQRFRDHRARRAPRRPIACCAARWACRSPSSRRRSPRASKLRGCPSCPRWRRSAATSRRASRAGCCSGSRCSMPAGAPRSRAPRSPPPSRAGGSRRSRGAAST